MGQTLVIAEKPSVAGDIARALGGFKKDGDFWVSDAMIVGSAVGHLLEIKAPEEYDVKRGRWSFANLPVLPPHFDLQPIKKSIKKFEGLEKKIRSRSVTDIINACDAGREGELIFRYIIQATGTKKPIRRLWCTYSVQFQRRRLLPYYRWPRADADSCYRCCSRGRDNALQTAELLGSACNFWRTSGGL